MGTRPEIIKLAPVVKALKHRKKINLTICATGQHEELAKQMLDQFSINPDVNLNISKYAKKLSETVGGLVQRIEEIIVERNIDLVVVQGDTASAFSAALASYHTHTPIAHVEAGLRTQNIYSPWPEEGYRAMISKISSLNFAPTELNRENLLRDGVNKEKIYVVGNTVVDSLILTIKKLEHGIISHLKIQKEIVSLASSKRFILVTGHRRENLDGNLMVLFNALVNIVKNHKDVHVIFPMHYNPTVRSQIKDSVLSSSPNIHLIEPLNYEQFVWLMSKCHHIITDSGGIQEEAPSLGKPVLVVRDTTERPEAVDAGVVDLVGVKQNDIETASTRLLNDHEYYGKISSIQNPYGLGDSAEKIATVIEKYLF